MKHTETVYDAILTEPNVQEEKFVLPNLAFCIAMDLAGIATYALPALGEWADILWAPISGFIFMKTFGGMTGKIGGIVAMIEEAIPFTDFIPTFTIGYFYTRNRLKKGKKVL